MLESDAVRKIGFTGSTAVGKQLMAGAAATVKRVSLELARPAPRQRLCAAAVNLR
jgi:succinate-semialdehyde dehydrogenase